LKLRFAALVICLLHLQNAGNCSSLYLQQENDSIPATPFLTGKLQVKPPDQARIVKWLQKSRYILPALLVGYGFTSLNRGITWQTDRNVRHELLEEYPHFSTKLDDKLQYAPVAAVYTLNIMGVKTKNSLLDISFQIQ